MTPISENPLSIPYQWSEHNAEVARALTPRARELLRILTTPMAADFVPGLRRFEYVQSAFGEVTDDIAQEFQSYYGLFAGSTDGCIFSLETLLRNPPNESDVVRRWAGNLQLCNDGIPKTAALLSLGNMCEHLGSDFFQTFAEVLGHELLRLDREFILNNPGRFQVPSAGGRS
jgi:hypothetical protein